MSPNTVLRALSDPTRRRIYERLRRGPRSVTELARHAGVSQPAASQHLRTLRQAQLVTDRRVGTVRLYRTNPQGLVALRTYVESLWSDALTAYASDDSAPRKRGRK
jgi:DNA-binding transcriptional ArsR family regulator